MAEYNLINEVLATGTHGTDILGLDSIPLMTLMTDDFLLYKTADKNPWITGYLTFTATIENNSAIAYTNVQLTDQLDTRITLVDNSVTINGVDAVKDTDYTFVGGKLTVLLASVPEKIDDVPGKIVVTFQVSKV